MIGFYIKCNNRLKLVKSDNNSNNSKICCKFGMLLPGPEKICLRLKDNAQDLLKATNAAQNSCSKKFHKTRGKTCMETCKSFLLKL